MAIELYVVSGFLGAGKTTLIQKLLQDALSREKVVLIENDFGEVSVDAALLKKAAIEVKEINSGCICCSLQGDFIASITEIAQRFTPDKIIIEPSGLAKLSDVVKACTNKRIPDSVRLKTKFVVVDATVCADYLEEFGEFYSDQIENAGVIVLSRVEELGGNLPELLQTLQKINPEAVIFAEQWDGLAAETILQAQPKNKLEPVNSCSEDNEPEHDHDHAHNHAADEVFESATIHSAKKFKASELKKLIAQAEKLAPDLLRLKGIVKGENGYLNLQYVPGDLQITNTDSIGDFICFIGKALPKEELAQLFV